MAYAALWHMLCGGICCEVACAVLWHMLSCGGICCAVAYAVRWRVLCCGICCAVNKPTIDMLHTCYTQWCCTKHHISRLSEGIIVGMIVVNER